jgi:hypothetical protein
MATLGATKQKIMASMIKYTFEKGITKHLWKKYFKNT